MQQTGDRCSAESGEAHLVSAQQRLAIGERACAGGLHPKKALCLGHFGLCGRQPSSSRWGGAARRRGRKGREVQWQPGGDPAEAALSWRVSKAGVSAALQSNGVGRACAISASVRVSVRVRVRVGVGIAVWSIAGDGGKAPAEPQVEQCAVCGAQHQSQRHSSDNATMASSSKAGASRAVYGGAAQMVCRRGRAADGQQRAARANVTSWPLVVAETIGDRRESHRPTSRASPTKLE